MVERGVAGDANLNAGHRVEADSVRRLFNRVDRRAGNENSFIVEMGVDDDDASGWDLEVGAREQHGFP